MEDNETAANHGESVHSEPNTQDKKTQAKR